MSFGPPLALHLQGAPKSKAVSLVPAAHVGLSGQVIRDSVLAWVPFVSEEGEPRHLELMERVNNITSPND